MNKVSRAIALAGLLVYLAISLSQLDVFPIVGEDEPWIAAAPYKLATEGVYGSDLFAGYYGVDRHNYQHMPVYPLMQAGVFKLLGVSVFTMRLLPVAFGFALLVVAFVVGRQAGGDRVGALAVVLLIGLRITAGDEATGVLLLDRARINRYDIAVPVFGLLALWAFGRAHADRAGRWYAATGLLTGVASLCHLYGVFWLPIFLGLLWHRQGWRVLIRRPAWLILGGFAATWLPWIAYVASGWTDYLGQMRFVASRFDLLNASFYVDNALRGSGPISLGWAARTIGHLSWARVGTWTMLLGVPLAVGVMLWTTRRTAAHAAQALAVAALAHVVMFTVLLQVKTINYMIALWPVCALCLAWLGIWLWDHARPVLVHAALVVLLVLILIEGSMRVAHAKRVASQTLPHDWFTAEVARCIPPDALIVGLQHYWLGLRQFRYRTWLMPANYAHPRYYHEPMTLDEALERIDPDVILIDRFMADLFKSTANPGHPYHQLYVGFERFMARRRAEPLCTIDGRQYGPMQIYRIPPK